MRGSTVRQLRRTAALLLAGVCAERWGLAKLEQWPPAPVPSLASGLRCPYSVRVYVYEFSASLAFNQLAAKGRKSPSDSHFDGEHLLAQFSLEFILSDFFEQACVRTMDPDVADFYFVPFYSDIEYRAAGRPDGPSAHGEAILDILERNDTRKWVERFGVTDKYWLRWPERHLLVQPAPVTGWRHPKGRRGWHHYKVQLAAPIFLSIEVSRSWTLQYPSCSSKNIVLPYPIPGRAWHDQGRSSWAAMGAAVHGDAGTKRPIQAVYRGGRHGCPNIRQVLASELRSDEKIASAIRRVEERYRLLASPGPQAIAPRQLLMHVADFCPCPEGDSPSAKRQYDALLAGCVPVVVSDDALFAYDQHFQTGALNSSKFSLRVPEQTVLDRGVLPSIRAVEPAQLDELRRNAAVAANAYRYYARGSYAEDPLPARRYPDGGALALLVADLDLRRRQRRVSAAWHECSAELAQPHFHLSKQYCGKPSADREVLRLRANLAKARSAAERAQIQRGIRDWEQGHIFRTRL